MININNRQALIRAATITTISANNCRVAGHLTVLECNELTALPDDLHVEESLNIIDCFSLTSLPRNCRVGISLNIHNCPAMTSLPDVSVSCSISIRSCPALTSLPRSLRVRDSLILEHCTGLTTLPSHLSVGNSLVLTGCTGLIQTAELTQQLHDLAGRGCKVTWPKHFINASAADITRKIAVDETLAGFKEKLSLTSSCYTEKAIDLRALDKIGQKNKLPDVIAKQIGLYAGILKPNENLPLICYVNKFLCNGNLHEGLNQIEPLIQKLNENPEHLHAVDRMIGNNPILTPRELIDALEIDPGYKERYKQHTGSAAGSGMRPVPSPSHTVRIEGERDTGGDGCRCC